LKSKINIFDHTFIKIYWSGFTSYKYNQLFYDILGTYDWDRFCELRLNISYINSRKYIWWGSKTNRIQFKLVPELIQLFLLKRHNPYKLFWLNFFHHLHFPWLDWIRLEWILRILEKNQKAIYPRAQLLTSKLLLPIPKDRN